MSEGFYGDYGASATQTGPSQAEPVPVSSLRASVPSAGEGEDEIVTRLYRRFKDWSARGFGPDDVTWCEVKHDIKLMIAQTEPTSSQLVALIEEIGAWMQALAESDLDEGAADAVTVGMVFQQQARDVYLPRILGAIEAAPAQAIEARRAETLGSVHESAVRQDAPETPLSTPLPSGSIER